MKQYLFLIITIVLFSGCSVKMDPTNINQEILSNTNATKFLDSKTYYTYEEKDAKITAYFFKEKDGELTYTNAITFIPMDSTGQLYSAISQVVFTIHRLTNNKAKTIEEALVMEVRKNKFKKLFTDKEEYIIGNDFARDLTWSIREFNEMIERQENRSDRESAGIILPIF